MAAAAKAKTATGVFVIGTVARDDRQPFVGTSPCSDSEAVAGAAASDTVACMSDAAPRPGTFRAPSLAPFFVVTALFHAVCGSLPTSRRRMLTMVARSMKTLFALFVLLVACGPSMSPPPPRAAAPALGLSSEASPSELSFVEGPLPDALLVEREVEAPPPPRTPRGRPIVLRELDAPPMRHVVWVARDGALTSIDDAAAETADPRPLPSGGFRYVRIEAGARELVVVDADGRVVRSGRDGAGRVPTLGGHHSPRRMPFTDDGRFGTEQDVDEGTVVVRDFVAGTSREAALPASGTPSAIFVGDDGAVLVCSSASNGHVALRSGAHDLDDVGGRCVAASRDLSWVVASVDDAALIARRVRDGHRVSLPPGQLAAFDAQARFVVVACFDEASASTVLTRVSLSDGAQVVLAAVPSILDTLEIARDEVVVTARLPWPPVEAEPAHAFVVRLGGGELASFALPGGASVVVHVPTDAR